jgi:hypothetical protein
MCYLSSEPLTTADSLWTTMDNQRPFSLVVDPGSLPLRKGPVEERAETSWNFETTGHARPPFGDKEIKCSPPATRQGGDLGPRVNPTTKRSEQKCTLWDFDASRLFSLSMVWKAGSWLVKRETVPEKNPQIPDSGFRLLVMQRRLIRQKTHNVVTAKRGLTLAWLLGDLATCKHSVRKVRVTSPRDLLWQRWCINDCYRASAVAETVIGEFESQANPLFTWSGLVWCCSRSVSAQIRPVFVMLGQFRIQSHSKYPAKRSRMAPLLSTHCEGLRR